MQDNAGVSLRALLDKAAAEPENFSMAAALIFVSVPVVIFVFLCMMSNSKERSKRDILDRRFNQNIKRLPNFSPTHAFNFQHSWPAPFGAVFIDVDQRKICIAQGYCSAPSPARQNITPENPNIIPEPAVFLASKIQKLEIVNDLGQIVTQTVSQNVLGRAVVGGVVFGSTGAIVAGLSSPQVSVSSQQQRPKLCFYLNDVSAPYHEFSFFDIAEARKCYATISALIQSPVA